MALYPSLEDMKISQYHDAEIAASQRQPQSQPAQQQPQPVSPQALPPQQQQPPLVSLASAYPQLADEYMGLHLEPPAYSSLWPPAETQLTPANNEWQVVDATTANNNSSSDSTRWVAPLSSQNPGLARAAVTNAVREVWLQKNGKGKIGVKLRQVNNGVFVQFVHKDSPAAAARLRLGDQILSVDGDDTLGKSGEKVEKQIGKVKKSPFSIIVRDRPFERTVTLHKDSNGYLGFTHHDGRIKNIVKNSSAARNGLLTDQRIVEVNGQNVVGFNDKQLAKLIADAGNTVTLTILPMAIYEQIMKKIGKSQIKKGMDHSVPDVV